MPTEPLFRPISAATEPFIDVEFDGRRLAVLGQRSVAAALLAAGVSRFRSTPVSGAPRAPYCMMGVCFECLLEIDGVANRQACLVPVRPGMNIRSQGGARSWEADRHTANSRTNENATATQPDAVDCTVDVAVVGAGPAGLAAAATAAELGLSVALLDEQAHPGGQIYREVTRAGDDRLQVLGNDYAAGRALVERFTQSTARHLGGAAVWNVSRDRIIHYLKDGRSRSMTAGQVILCTGAMERPFPIPGWTLPGVMTAGAAQILLKSAGVAPSRPVVLAGCGPLLYLLAWQYLRAGVRIGAIADTTQRGDYLRALRHLGGALAGWRDVRKGLGLIRSIRSAGIPYYRAATDLAVEGGEQATALRFRTGATSHRVQADLVVLHQGVVPNNQITASLRLAHRWDDQQLCWVPAADAWGRLELGDFLIAGDGRGIAGGQAAALQGQIAGVAAAHDAGRLSELERDRQAGPLRSALRRQLHIRPFLDTLYRPKVRHRVPADDVIACRCEEVSAGELRRSVALGCLGPNQAKAFTRCGMGPCQGRLCGLTVTEIIAHERGVSPAEVGHYRVRPPIKPITLEELAAL